MKQRNSTPVLPAQQRQTIALAVKMLLAQLTLVIALSVLALLDSVQAAYSALLGGAIVIIAQSYFTFKALRLTGARQMLHVVRNFYIGAVGKLVITTMLFIVVFRLVPSINSPFMFGTFCAALSVSFIAPLLSKSKLTDLNSEMKETRNG